MSVDIKNIYEAMLSDADKNTAMTVLADALGKNGHIELANAYRWAAEHNKWPFVRHLMPYETFSTAKRQPDQKVGDAVYDWDTDRREHLICPPECRLPDDLYRAMCKIKDRYYGGVDMAFVLLANVLAGKTTYADLRAW